MKTLDHPSSLNLFKQFRQARTVLKETSRASNPAWYQEALDLDFQLHIRIDGTSVTSFFRHHKLDKWEPGIPLGDSYFQSAERATSFSEEVVKAAKAAKASSVGIVVYIADEFATAELKQELDSPSVLNDLRSKAFTSPAEILDDSSVLADQGSWRVIPYPAAKSDKIGTTINLSRHLEPFLTVLRQTGESHNFPVITQTLSAPLIVMSNLPQLLNRKPDKPFVCVLQYPWFTTLGFFNEHSDLRLIRNLQHRGAQRPSNFRNSFATTNAALEFVDPEVIILPLGSGVDPSLASNLQGVYPDSRIEVISLPESALIPVWSPELALTTGSTETEGKDLSHTFGVLKEEGWFAQDFLPKQKEFVEIYPSKTEMKALRLLKLGKIPIAALLLVGFAWMGLDIFKTTSKMEWSFDDSNTQNVQTRLQGLAAERSQFAYWDTMLEDRAKAWVEMESLAQLATNGSGLLVKDYQLLVRPESPGGKKAATTSAGFTKEWNINGFVKEDALRYLNSLNSREGITNHFIKVAKLTGNTAYDPSPVTRGLVVNIKTRENTGYNRASTDDLSSILPEFDDSGYPFSFTMKIVQRFESTDPLALKTTKAP